MSLEPISTIMTGLQRLRVHKYVDDMKLLSPEQFQEMAKQVELASPIIRSYKLGNEDGIRQTLQLPDTQKNIQRVAILLVLEEDGVTDFNVIQ